MSIFELSIKRPILITMGILVLVLFGALSFPKVPVDFLPSVEAPLATVLTIYPGADPETVEKEVTKKIEDALSELSGVDKLKSVSAENVSQVIVLFNFNEDANQAVQAVRDKVSRLSAQLPRDAQAPSVEKLDLGSAPVLTLAISGPGRVDEVTKLARDRVKTPLQSVSGVGSIDIVGGAEREIKVWADPLRLESAGLAVTDLVGALQASNLKYPGGAFKTEDKELTLKIDGEFTSVEQIGRLPIVDAGGRVVRVEDVARVEDGVEEARGSAVRDGEKTVMLLVRKQSGTNGVEVAHAIKAKLAAIEKNLPAGVSASIAVDNSLFTEDSFNSVWFDMALGCLLAVFVVLLFLRNGRATLVAAIAIPTAIVATFGFIWAMGFTFNMLTLIALTLAIGLIVDDAIVVIENTFRHLKEGKSKREAALEGVQEIAFAMLASTLSLVAVFLPGALAGGIAGIMLKEFGLTIVVAVCISLFASFTLTPMLGSRLLGGARDNWLFSLVRRALSALEGSYRGIIGWALRYRWATIGIAIAVLAATLFTMRFVHSEFIPTYDPGTINVKVTLPVGTALEKTERVAGRIATLVSNMKPEVLGTVVKVGADVREKQNVGEIVVRLSDKKGRKTTYAELVAKMRAQFEGEREAVVSIDPPDISGGGSGPMSGSSIQLNLRGDDLTLLERTANAVIREMSSVKGLIDVDSSYEGGKPEVRLVVDRDRAASLGVFTAQIGQVGRAYVGGVDASKLRVGGDEYDIRVRLPEDLRKSASQFGGLKIRSATTGKLVDVANAASLETVLGPTQIDRQARQRQITISANNTADFSLSEAQARVDAIAARVVPPTISVDYGGNVEMMGKTTKEFTTIFIIAVALIYIVLAAQFESLIQPFSVMTAMPLSVIGALLAILLTGTNLGIMSLLGMLMLMGLVAKNSILLVDYTNTLRRRGLSRTDALLKAGPTRLRPILMTTFAMVAAMIPVAVSDSWGSEMRAPIALPVIGGLLAGTLLTLVVVPVIYALLDDFGAFLARFFRKRDPFAKTVTAALACAVLLLPVSSWAQEGPPAPTSRSDSVATPRERPTITPGPALTLAQALELAKRRNLGLESARYEIEKARAQLKQSWGFVLPMLQGGMQYTRMDHEDTLDLAGSFAPLLDAMGIVLPEGAMGEPMLLNPQDKIAGSVQAALAVVDPKAWLTIRAAQKGVEVAELSIADGERQLLLGVSQAYYMTLMTRELIDLYAAQLDAAEAQLSVAEARYRAEAGRRIDVVRAQTDVEKTFQDLEAAHLAFDNARDALGVLVKADGLPLPQAAPSLDVPVGTEYEMAQRADSQRTDLRAGRAKVELHERLLDASWMQFLPAITAAWQGSYTFTEMPDMGSQDRSRWAFVLSLTVPIYNHFRYGDLDYKRAALKQSMVDLENLDSKASLAVRTAGRSYRSALTVVETAERQLALAQEGLTLAEAAYKAGAAGSLDVSEARRAYTSAGVNVATQRLRAQIALISLLDSVGEELLQEQEAAAQK